MLFANEHVDDLSPCVALVSRHSGVLFDAANHKKGLDCSTIHGSFDHEGGVSGMRRMEDGSVQSEGVDFFDGEVLSETKPRRDNDSKDFA